MVFCSSSKLINFPILLIHLILYIFDKNFKYYFLCYPYNIEYQNSSDNAIIFLSGSHIEKFIVEKYLLRGACRFSQRAWKVS